MRLRGGVLWDRILANAPTLVCCGLGWVFVVRCLMSDEPEGSWGAWLSWSLGGLVAVYFGFPALWLWPIWKVYGLTTPGWVHALCVPMASLVKVSPLYGEWVLWNAEVVGIK